MNDLLIATINKLILWQNGKQKTISEGNYYGLSWDSEYVYCSKNKTHLPVSEIEMFDYSLKKCGALHMKYIGGIHQILAIDDLIYIANTEANCIDIYDGSQTLKQINWTGLNRDRHHINSIWIDGGKIYAVESGLAGDFSPPAIQVLNINYKPIRRIELPGAIHIHNVYVEDGFLYCCGKYGLVRKKLRANRYSTIDLRIDQNNGFLRGLARSENHFYIGESQILPRTERPHAAARIIVLDDNLEVYDTIELKGTGQIQEIRIINARDLAHNKMVFYYGRKKPVKPKKQIIKSVIPVIYSETL